MYQKILGQPYAASTLYVMDVDKNAAYPKAFLDLKNSNDLDKNCKFRQCKYLNKSIEPDHRFIKQSVKYKLWFRKFTTASITIAGYKIMQLIKKGQIRYVKKVMLWLKKIY